MSPSYCTVCYSFLYRPLNPLSCRRVYLEQRRRRKKKV